MDSPSFIRTAANGSFLCIPSAFAAWTGEALDMKTPLLRSNEVVSKATIRLLRMLGNKDASYAFSNLGVEQEFFVIDRGFFNARPDLIACGRTLQGAQPAKGQQMEDHYFGALDRRILAFLQDVEWRLWRLGVPSVSSSLNLLKAIWLMRHSCRQPATTKSLLASTNWHQFLKRSL
jgi:glutamine synthetase